MKFTLLNLLTVSLVTFVAIAPDLLVLGIVWEKHLEYVQTQHLVSDVKTVMPEIDAVVYIQNKALETSNNKNIINYSYADFSEPLLTSEGQDMMLKILLGVFFFIPICLWLVIYAYDKYLIHRAAVYQQRVAFLERLWQQSM
jgi:hypothetical protein